MFVYIHVSAGDLTQDLWHACPLHPQPLLFTLKLMLHFELSFAKSLPLFH
jgi:hypothetical protein